MLYKLARLTGGSTREFKRDKISLLAKAHTLCSFCIAKETLEAIIHFLKTVLGKDKKDFARGLCRDNF